MGGHNVVGRLWHLYMLGLQALLLGAHHTHDFIIGRLEFGCINELLKHHLQINLRLLHLHLGLKLGL